MSTDDPQGAHNPNAGGMGPHCAGAQGPGTQAGHEIAGEIGPGEHGPVVVIQRRGRPRNRVGDLDPARLESLAEHVITATQNGYFPAVIMAENARALKDQLQKLPPGVRDQLQNLWLDMNKLEAVLSRASRFDEILRQVHLALTGTVDVSSEGQLAFAIG